MKKEIYSCIKILESLKKSCVDAFNTKTYEVSGGLWKQYVRIYEILREKLEKDEFVFIPDVKISYPYESDEHACFIMEVSSATSGAISYLLSLDSSLDREFTKKKRELEQKEKDLEYLQKENESLKRLLNKSIEAVNQIPEVRRSEAVAEIKKQHREIEKHSRKISKNEK